MEPERYSLPFTHDVHGCSQAGAEKALPKAGSQRALVYQMVVDHGPVTDQQLVALTGLPLNVVNARRWQLVNDGFVQNWGVAKGEHGVMNTLWRVAKS